MLGVAAIAVIGGVAAAVVMAAQPTLHHHRSTALAAAASYLGVSQTRLRGELHSGKSLAQIADATSGKSAAGLVGVLETDQRQKLAADAAALPQRVKAEVERPHVARARGKSVRAAASYLGVGATQLRAERRSGKTLAQIAEATSGKSVAGLVAALVAAKRSTIEAARAAGAITPAHAEKLRSTLVARMTARVHRD